MKKLLLLSLSILYTIIGFSQATPTLQKVANAGNTAHKKLFYNDNYSGSATSRWLTDKNYVDSLFTVILPGGGISVVNGTSPIVVSGGATPTVSITTIPVTSGGTGGTSTATSGTVLRGIGGIWSPSGFTIANTFGSGEIPYNTAASTMKCKYFQI